MRPLIIVAHPSLESSHVGHGLAHARTLLENAGVEYDLIDLYADRFDPVMRKEPSKRHLEQIERYQDLIAGSDRIVILYPVWWNGPPAILKGFFDCILTQGWAYHYHATPIPKVGLPIGHLKGKRAAIVSTSGALDILHRIVQRSRAGRIISHDILGFVGVHTKRFNIGGCQGPSAVNRTRVERKVSAALRWVGAFR